VGQWQSCGLLSGHALARCLAAGTTGLPPTISAARQASTSPQVTLIVRGSTSPTRRRCRRAGSTLERRCPPYLFSVSHLPCGLLGQFFPDARQRRGSPGQVGPSCWGLGSTYRAGAFTAASNRRAVPSAGARQTGRGVAAGSVSIYRSAPPALPAQGRSRAPHAGSSPPSARQQPYVLAVDLESWHGAPARRPAWAARRLAWPARCCTVAAGMRLGIPPPPALKNGTRTPPSQVEPFRLAKKPRRAGVFAVRSLPCPMQREKKHVSRSQMVLLQRRLHLPHRQSFSMRTSPSADFDLPLWRRKTARDWGIACAMYRKKGRFLFFSMKPTRVRCTPVSVSPGRGWFRRSPPLDQRPGRNLTLGRRIRRTAFVAVGSPNNWSKPCMVVRELRL